VSIVKSKKDSRQRDVTLTSKGARHMSKPKTAQKTANPVSKNAQRRRSRHLRQAAKNFPEPLLFK